MPESKAWQEVNFQRIRSKIITWSKDNFREFAWRSSNSHWHGLLAEILLQRTRAEAAEKVYLKLIEKYPDPKSLAEAPVEEILNVIFPIGLRWRAPLLKELAERITENENQVPLNHAELIALPAVGEYVSSAFLSMHAGKRASILDANVVRMLTRLICATYHHELRRSRWVRQFIEELTPEEAQIREFNYGLLDLSMTICVTKPKCHICPLRSDCCTGKRLTEHDSTP